MQDYPFIRESKLRENKNTNANQNLKA